MEDSAKLTILICITPLVNNYSLTSNVHIFIDNVFYRNLTYDSHNKYCLFGSNTNIILLNVIVNIQSK